MPHVHRRATTHLAMPPDQAAALTREMLNLDKDLSGTLPGDPHSALSITIEADPQGGADLTLDAMNETRVAFFGWWFRPVFRREMRRHLDHAVTTLEASALGRVPPSPPRPSPMAPPTKFEVGQSSLLSTVALAGLIASFAVALFGQNSNAIADTFQISNGQLGSSLAITRFGALIALFATAFADRFGRRRILLLAVAGVCITNALSAFAPTIETFTIAQLFLRGCANTVLVVGGIAVVEEAPEGARAFAVAMFALASGAGFALAVALLPLTDFGNEMWRISFGVSGIMLFVVPLLARNLKETTRYTRLAARTTKRGGFREVFDPAHRRRFLLLGAIGFLVNILSAPSAQLTNRFLGDERDFSGSSIAGFRAITNGIPGLFGIVLAGRLNETRGRRPVAGIGLIAATVFTMIFFLGGGAVLWIASTLAIIAAASSSVAIGTMDVELFPTEVRGTSNALLLICSVLGSATGLIVAGALADRLDGLGYAIALCGIAPLLAGVFLIPRLPESKGRALDDVSPSEV